MTYAGVSGATQVTTQGSLSVEAKTFYDRTLLERALPELAHARFAQRRELGRRSGKTIEFRKFTALAPATTPLTEGVTPGGNSLAATAITATINQYGDYVEGSDLLDLTSIDPVLSETAELLGEQAGLTIDRVIREVLAAGTSVQYANGRVSRVTVAATDVLTVLEVRKAVRFLKNQKARPIAGGDFVALVNPNTTFDLQSDPNWKDPHNYSAVQNIFDGEIGRLYGVRFVETTETKVFTTAGAGGIDVAASVFLGANAYGIIPLQGADLEFIFKPPNDQDKSDPLNQRWTSGWKVSFAAKILNDLFMVRVEHAMTA
jgi:N4-gp56 family major capsid protein